MEEKFLVEARSDTNKSLITTPLCEYRTCSQLVDTAKTSYLRRPFNSQTVAANETPLSKSLKPLPMCASWSPLVRDKKRYKLYNVANPVLEESDKRLLCPISSRPTQQKGSTSSDRKKLTLYKFDDFMWRNQVLNQPGSQANYMCSSPLKYRNDSVEIEIDHALITSDKQFSTQECLISPEEITRLTNIWHNLCQSRSDTLELEITSSKLTAKSTPLKCGISESTEDKSSPKAQTPKPISRRKRVYLERLQRRKKRKIGPRKLSQENGNDFGIKSSPKTNTDSIQRIKKKICPRSKTGCWTCRVRHKACPENKPICRQCERLKLDCDYSQERPPYMYIKELQVEKLKQIREITNVQKKLNFRSRRLKKDATLVEESENK